MIDPTRFSRLLLTLYRAAESTSMRQFHQVALGEIQQLLPFDGVLLTTSGLTGSRSSHHVWLIDGVPRELPKLFESDLHAQAAIGLAMESLGKPWVQSPEDIASHPSLAAFAAESGMAQVMKMSEWNETLNTFTVLVLGRRDPAWYFTEADQLLLGLLMPHLQTLMVRNVESQIMSAIVNRIAGTIGLAVVALDDAFVLEEVNFTPLLHEAWPGWQGPRLPEALEHAMRSRKPHLSCKGATVHLIYAEDHVLLLAAAPSVVDSLTHKEFAIASEFAQGKSYKEVARSHGLPPETVRSRLRSVYEKLNIGDKAELSRRFAQTDLLNDLHDLF